METVCPTNLCWPILNTIVAELLQCEPSKVIVSLVWFAHVVVIYHKKLNFFSSFQCYIWSTASLPAVTYLGLASVITVVLLFITFLLYI